MQLTSERHLLCFERHLLERLSTLQCEPLADLLDRTRQFVVDGGKRLRPQLCLWTWQALRDDEPTKALLDIASGWEIFHAFLLAHDDIIDRAEHRRRNRSLHRQLADVSGDSNELGQSQAIVAGDLLFSLASSLFQQMDADPDLRQRVTREYLRISSLTGLGQMLDIELSRRPVAEVTEAELRQEYAWKTGHYSFEGPMLTAALLAGADQASLTSLSRFALALGEAYQLHNDLLDLAGDITPGCDIMQQKRTPPLVRTRTRMPNDARASLDAMFAHLAAAGSDAPLELGHDIRLLLCSHGIDTIAQQMIAEALTTADKATSDNKLCTKLADAKRSLLSMLRDNYFQPIRIAHYA